MAVLRPKDLGLPRGHLLLVVTGALAARRAPDLVESVRGWYPEVTVRVLVTANALRFVTRDLLRVASRQPVYGPEWEDAHGLEVPHRDLAAWADAVVVYPASGTTLSRLAAGLGDSLATATVQDAECPVVLAPGVSPGFAARRIHEENIERLRRSDYVVMDAVIGRAASDGSLNRTSPPPWEDVLMAVARAVRRGQLEGGLASPRRDGVPSLTVAR